MYLLLSPLYDLLLVEKHVANVNVLLSHYGSRIKETVYSLPFVCATLTDGYEVCWLIQKVIDELW